MSIPQADFDPCKPPGMTNPEGSTSTSEEKKEVPLNVSPNIKIDYNIMSIQLLTMNITTMNDLNMYQVPPQDVSPLAYLFNTRPGPSTPPPMPPGTASRPPAPVPSGGSSLPTLPVVRPQDTPHPQQSSRVPGLNIQGIRHVQMTDFTRTPLTSRSEGLPENKSPMDQPPVTIRVSSTDRGSPLAKPSEGSPPEGIPLQNAGDPILPRAPIIQQRTASHVIAGPTRTAYDIPELRDIMYEKKLPEVTTTGPIPPALVERVPGLPGVPSIHMTRVVYKQLPGLQDLLYEKPK